MPAMTAFCTSSKLARPDTCSTAAAQRKPVVHDRPADDLVDGVVAADVFADDEQLARRGVEQRRRVQPARLVEHGLPGAQRVGQRDEQSRHPRRRRRSTTSYDDTVSTASMDALPHSPHELVV